MKDASVSHLVPLEVTGSSKGTKVKCIKRSGGEDSDRLLDWIVSIQ
jgi:hypothetical protein